MTKRKFVPVDLLELQQASQFPSLHDDASELIGESWELWQGDVRRALRCHYRDCGVHRSIAEDAVNWTASELLHDVCDRFARGLVDPIWLTDRGWWLQQARNIRQRWFDIERASQCRRYRPAALEIDSDIEAPADLGATETAPVADSFVAQLLELLPAEYRGKEWIVRLIVAMSDNPGAPYTLLAQATDCTEPTARKRKQRLRDLLTVGALFQSVSR